MQTITLYRYKRGDSGVTVSPVKPEGEYTTLFRLIADEGMTLTHADHEDTPCIDVESVEGWSEKTELDEYSKDELEEALEMILSGVTE